MGWALRVRLGKFVEQFGGLAASFHWRYRGRFLRLVVYRRGPDCPLEQRARRCSAIPERIYRQHAGGDHLGCPSARGGIEGPATSRAAEHLRLAAVNTQGEPLPAPHARRGRVGPVLLRLLKTAVA